MYDDFTKGVDDWIFAHLKLVVIVGVLLLLWWQRDLIIGLLFLAYQNDELMHWLNHDFFGLDCRRVYHRAAWMDKTMTSRRHRTWRRRRTSQPSYCSPSTSSNCCFSSIA